jgi:hypothetical protein
MTDYKIVLYLRIVYLATLSVVETTEHRIFGSFKYTKL